VDIVITWPYKTKIATQVEVFKLKTFRPKYFEEGHIFQSFIENAKRQITEKYLIPMQLDHGFIIIWDQVNVKELSQPLCERSTVNYNGKRLEIITLWNRKLIPKKTKEEILNIFWLCSLLRIT